jgi:putative phage-type endonuclease
MSVGILDTSTGKMLAEPEWLDLRRTTLGASECPAALGFSEFKSPVDLWQEKTNRRAPDPATDRMLSGRRAERYIQEEYEERTGVKLDTQLFCRSAELPWLTATLDGLRPDGRIVEFKTADGWSREWGDEEAEEIPMRHLIQVHQQMLVAERHEADVVVLWANWKMRIYHVQRNAELCHMIRVGAERFWNCVQNDTPPDWGKLDARALAILNPECTGTVDLDDDLAAAVQTYAENAYLIKRHEKTNETLKAQILAAIGNAEFGRLPSGQLVKRHRIEMPEQIKVTKAYVRHYFSVPKGANE